MSPNRDRFEQELQRLSDYDMAAVVVEAGMNDAWYHRYRSDMLPHSLLQSIFTFQVRYTVPFMWCGDRQRAEYATFWILAKFERERRVLSAV